MFLFVSKRCTVLWYGSDDATREMVVAVNRIKEQGTAAGVSVDMSRCVWM